MVCAITCAFLLIILIWDNSEKLKSRLRVRGVYEIFTHTRTAPARRAINLDVLLMCVTEPRAVLK